MTDEVHYVPLVKHLVGEMYKQVLGDTEETETWAEIVFDKLLLSSGMEDNPEGFISFYMYITRGLMPMHAIGWVYDIYAKKSETVAL